MPVFMLGNGGDQDESGLGQMAEQTHTVMCRNVQR